MRHVFIALIKDDNGNSTIRVADNKAAAESIVDFHEREETASVHLHAIDFAKIGLTETVELSERTLIRHFDLPEEQPQEEMEKIERL